VSADCLVHDDVRERRRRLDVLFAAIEQLTLGREVPVGERLVRAVPVDELVQVISDGLAAIGDAASELPTEVDPTRPGCFAALDQAKARIADLLGLAGACWLCGQPFLCCEPGSGWPWPGGGSCPSCSTRTGPPRS
jgi:hypothetical protein